MVVYELKLVAFEPVRVCSSWRGARPIQAGSLCEPSTGDWKGA